MSTKTTFKRVALVAVAALGFGVLTGVAAQADTYSSGMSTNYSSVTTVGAADTTTAFFAITVSSDTASTGLGTTDTLVATVDGVPVGLGGTAKNITDNASDLVLSSVAPVGCTSTNCNGIKDLTNAGIDLAGGGVASWDNSSTGYYGWGTHSLSTATLSTVKNRTYFLAVTPAALATVYNQGTYSIGLTLSRGDAVLATKTLSAKWVTTSAKSGAKLSMSNSGVYVKGEDLSATLGAAKYIRVGITDANGGRLQITDGATPTAISVEATDTTTVPNRATLTIADNGTDEVSNTKAWANDGAYQVITGTIGAGWKTGAVTVTARYGTATPATSSLTMLGVADGTTAVVAVAADGLGTTGDGSSLTPWSLPITTKAITFTVNGTAGKSYSYQVSWSGVASGDQSIAGSTPKIVYADSAGKLNVTVTNGNPTDGATATVTFSGWTVNPDAQHVQWNKAGKFGSISMTMDQAYVAKKSTNKFVATVLDTLGNPLSGVVLEPSLSTVSANYSATKTYASVSTNAAGEASFSLTDALAAVDGTDAVSLTVISTDGSGTAATSTITYAAAAPSVTSIDAYYSSDSTVTDADAITTVVPAMVYAVAATATKFSIVSGRDNRKSTGTGQTDQFVIKADFGTPGASVTATASSGAYVLSGSGLQKSSYTTYSDADGLVLFYVGSNAAGTNTITIASGTATSVVKFAVKTAVTETRNIAVSAANGDVTAKVTDRYGNGVSGVDVQLSLTSGTLGNGQRTSSYKTDANGSVTVIPQGSGTTTVTAISSTGLDANYTTSAKGYVGTTQVEPTLIAGNDTATLDVAISTVSNSDAVAAANKAGADAVAASAAASAAAVAASAAASAAAVEAATAAADAAAEATDAANAATDAANASAEAGDAATAAAQDAADAVAALSTQVSEMISALKAQLTALTNLVIKIQKKVKA